MKYIYSWRKRRKRPLILLWVVFVTFIMSCAILAQFLRLSLTPFEAHYNDLMPSPIKKVSTPSYKIVNSFPRVVTGYSAEAAQTDSTPHITANGTDLRKYKGLPIVATNELPFGTKVRINGVVMVVGDRMNKRYPTRYDILFPNRKAALQWGKRVVAVEILK